MKTFLNKFTLPLAFAFLGTSIAHANIISEDNFEQGNWASLWGSKTGVSITSNVAKDGTYSAKFVYPAKADGGDGWSELRFDLGGNYKELTIQFDLYIPANYEHRNSTGPDNNKFFRLWHTSGGYSTDDEKIGASLKPSSSSTGSGMVMEWRDTANEGVGVQDSASNFIVPNDYGKWTKFVIYVKSPTDSTPAVMRFYKNGTLFTQTTAAINYIPGTQGYRYGYLLGWSNSGFNQETVFYMDNVKFYDADIMSNLPMPPTQLFIN